MQPRPTAAVAVTIQAIDDGGTANGGADTSAAQTMQITLTAVNDAPSFTAGADQTVVENTGAQSVPGWASAISPGPANEAGQTVSFTLTSSNPALFTAGGQPAVASDGTLTFTPATGAHGTATITIRAIDDGGTANGGIDTSAAQTFTITITNLPPTAIADTASVAENDAAGVTFNVLSNDTDPEGDPLSVASYDDSTIANGSVTSNGAGSFTYTPAAHFAGTDSFTYTVTDGNGGTSTALVTITVTPVPDPPATADDAYLTRKTPPHTTSARRARKRLRLQRRHAHRRHDTSRRAHQRHAQPRRRRLLHLHPEPRLHRQRHLHLPRHQLDHGPLLEWGGHDHDRRDVQRLPALLDR